MSYFRSTQGFGEFEYRCLDDVLIEARIADDKSLPEGLAGEIVGESRRQQSNLRRALRCLVVVQAVLQTADEMHARGLGRRRQYIGGMARDGVAQGLLPPCIKPPHAPYVDGIVAEPHEIGEHRLQEE